MKIFSRALRLSWVCAIMSIFTLVAYHLPFFRLVLRNIEGGFNGVMITGGLALIMLALNYFFYYLVLRPGKLAGKVLLVFMFIGDAISLYFVNTYEVLITDKMMGNVFNTQFSEASGFFSFSFVLYVLFLGILPSAWLFMQKIEYDSWKRYFANIGSALAAVLAVAFANMQNWPWIDRNSTELGSLLMPWSYTVNTVRFYNGEKKRNQKEILLPDATISNDRKDVCILIIGESARRQNFSLYGYEKETNPLMAKDSVTVLPADAAATYTTAGVKALLSHQPSGKLYEILPNYLHRTGVDVTWRTSNWGEPPVHIEKYYKSGKLKEMYPEADGRYDGILLAGLKEVIENSQEDKVMIILHTGTSHGPTYNKKYPAEFEVFTPVCNTVEMSKADPVELMNAYDNTILYTDFLVHSATDIIRSVTDRRGCVLFVSDHGESLGENNLYMHGVPMSMAPKEQIEIPFIVWTSDKTTVKNLDKVGQYHVFHSVLDFFGIESPVFNEELSIFE